MTTKIKTIALAFLPALVLAGFYIAGQVMAQPAEQQQTTSTQTTEAPTVIEKPMITEPPQAEPEPEPAPVPAPVELAPKPQPKYPTCNVRENPYCYGTRGVDEYGTPMPEVNTVEVSQPWVRSDGYFNYCYLMDNGNWTTVTGKLELGKGIYYYGGTIDADSEAPAYAVESQQWCAANVPAEAR